MATPLTVGLIPIHLFAPALPIDRNECSELDTLPIVALHSERTLLTSPLLNLSVTYLPSIARI